MLSRFASYKERFSLQSCWENYGVIELPVFVFKVRIGFYCIKSVNCSELSSCLFDTGNCVKWIPQMTFSIKTETGFGTFLGFYLRLKKSCSWKHLWLPAFDYQLFLYVECNEIYEAVQAFLSHNWWFQQCLERKQCGGKKFFDLTYCS